MFQTLGGTMTNRVSVVCAGCGETSETFTVCDLWVCPHCGRRNVRQVGLVSAALERPLVVGDPRVVVPVGAREVQLG